MTWERSQPGPGPPLSTSRSLLDTPQRGLVVKRSLRRELLVDVTASKGKSFEPN